MHLKVLRPSQKSKIYPNSAARTTCCCFAGVHHIAKRILSSQNLLLFLSNSHWSSGNQKGCPPLCFPRGISKNTGEPHGPKTPETTFFRKARGSTPAVLKSNLVHKNGSRKSNNRFPHHSFSKTQYATIVYAPYRPGENI